jgi:hypothetical protein
VYKNGSITWYLKNMYDFHVSIKNKNKRRALPLTEHVQCARYSFKVVNLTDRKLENREAK